LINTTVDMASVCELWLCLDGVAVVRAEGWLRCRKIRKLNCRKVENWGLSACELFSGWQEKAMIDISIGN
jgi:hypothetical protein